VLRIARRNLALALEVGRTRLQPHHVRLLQRQFGRVLDRDDALVVRDETRQTVEHRGLARARAAGDQDVEPRLDHRLQHRNLSGEMLSLANRSSIE